MISKIVITPYNFRILRTDSILVFKRVKMSNDRLSTLASIIRFAKNSNPNHEY